MHVAHLLLILLIFFVIWMPTHPLDYRLGTACFHYQGLARLIGGHFVENKATTIQNIFSAAILIWLSKPNPHLSPYATCAFPSIEVMG